MLAAVSLIMQACFSKWRNGRTIVLVEACTPRGRKASTWPEASAPGSLSAVSVEDAVKALVGTLRSRYSESEGVVMDTFEIGFIEDEYRRSLSAFACGRPK
ncbi:MAG: hypothetical protein K0R61_3670 [Microvirga sp.]|nr:hypothetical protein [Microvirga sp.]